MIFPSFSGFDPSFSPIESVPELFWYSMCRWDDDYIIINSVNFSNNISEKESNWLCRKGNLKEGMILKGEDIEKAIETYKGTGSFSEVTYTIEKVENENANDTIEAFDVNLKLKKSI